MKGTHGAGRAVSHSSEVNDRETVLFWRMVPLSVRPLGCPLLCHRLLNVETPFPPSLPLSLSPPSLSAGEGIVTSHIVYRQGSQPLPLLIHPPTSPFSPTSIQQQLARSHGATQLPLPCLPRFLLSPSGFCPCMTSQ